MESGKKCTSDASEKNEFISLSQNVPGCENAGLEVIHEWLENYVIDDTTGNDIAVVNEEVIEDELD